MAIHNTRGNTGEWLAARWLEEREYKILVCNWRYKHLEVDIIAAKGVVLHIVEVKTRHSDVFGFPEESVTRKKFNNLKIAAEQFMRQYPYWKRVQFDILSIVRSVVKGDQYTFLEDVYL